MAFKPNVQDIPNYSFYPKEERRPIADSIWAFKFFALTGMQIWNSVSDDLKDNPCLFQYFLCPLS